MLFTTFAFLVFFPLTLATYFLAPARWHWLVLLLASGVFYGWGQPALLLFLFLPALTTYLVALRISQTSGTRSRKQWLVLGITLASAALLVFKYTDFVGATLFHLGGLLAGGSHYRPLDLLLPVGISFYTLRMIGYLVDVYWQKMPVERHAGHLLLYVAFFPQLLAGPIERAPHFLPQLGQRAPFDLQRICDGGKRVAWGFFKKLVIADRLAIVVDSVYGNVPDHTGPALLIATLFYAVQIYCDFSAYSDMAIGFSRMLGFETVENFRAPYLSTSVSQFWTRWHISLSTWLRDYLFLPISYAVMGRIRGERLWGVRAESWGYISATLITMFLCGLWHGASWTMAIWGLLHGGFLVTSHLSRRLRRRLVRWSGMGRAPGLHRALQLTITFSGVGLAWIFFRAKDLAGALTIAGNLFQGSGTFFRQLAGRLLFKWNVEPLRRLFETLNMEPYSLGVLLGAIVVLMIVDRGIDRGDLGSRLRNHPGWLRMLCYYSLLMSILLFQAGSGGAFIYFRF